MKIAAYFSKSSAKIWFLPWNSRSIACLTLFFLLLAPASASDFSSQNPQKDLPRPERIDLNYSSQAELMRIPGITRTWADRIIRFRPYTQRRQLLDYGVLPGELYLRVRFFTIVHQKPPK